MDGWRIGTALRTVRRRSGLRQEDLALRAGASRSTVSRVERGDLAGVTLGTAAALSSACGARIDLKVYWRGAAMDRLLDEGHALLAGSVVDLLCGWGWASEVEVSFSHFGERGSIDILAWHASTQTLLVIEIKTELGSVEGTLRPMDAKVRLAALIARDRFGWRASQVGRLLVFPADATVRRQVERHEAVFATTLPARSVDVRRWCESRSARCAGSGFFQILVARALRGILQPSSASERRPDRPRSVRSTRSSAANEPPEARLPRNAHPTRIWRALTIVRVPTLTPRESGGIRPRAAHPAADRRPACTMHGRENSGWERRIEG